MSAPRYATLIGLGDREPKGRVRIVREYPAVTKVRYWLGSEWGWSDVQDAHPDTILRDGGRACGWAPMRLTPW